MREETAKNYIAEIGWEIDVELSRRELLSIGKIVALWGSLEHEIFCQTLMCFGDLSVSQLPKEMNNMQFSQVLDLWETHVINKVAGRRKEILQKQLKNIRHYHEFRNALVHGMWKWSKASPEKITATRVRKNEILNTHFTADDLSSLASELAAINFNIRYPGGPGEYAKSMAKEGVYLSRRAVCLMTGNTLLDDLLPSFPVKNINKPKS